jgi:hypothetical protein
MCPAPVVRIRNEQQLLDPLDPGHAEFADLLGPGHDDLTVANLCLDQRRCLL